ncbi:MAG: GNAT family N-acetyltransferase [Candidatus Woesearchaeota archaeon]
MLLEIILTNASTKELPQVYPSFSKEFSHESKGMDYLEKLMEKKKYLLLLIKDQHTLKNIGYAFIFESTNSKFLWIDYVAIFPEYRNTGIGKVFIKKLFSEYSKNTLGIFFEIDKYFDTIEEKISIEKRVNFYKKFNAQKLNVDYLFESDGKFVEMDLYFIPMKETNLLEGTVLKDCLIEFFDYFYDEKTRSTLDFPYNTTFEAQSLRS